MTSVLRQKGIYEPLPRNQHVTFSRPNVINGDLVLAIGPLCIPLTFYLRCSGKVYVSWELSLYIETMLDRP